MCNTAFSRSQNAGNWERGESGCSSKLSTQNLCNLSSREDYFEILELCLLRPLKAHSSASYECLKNNLQQMSRAIVHSSLDIVFHCVISQIPSWWWCKLFIHQLASLPAHTQPSLLPRPIARLAIPLCIVTILAFSCAALVALRPLLWSTKSQSYLKIYPVWW